MAASLSAARSSVNTAASHGAAEVSHPPTMTFTPESQNGRRGFRFQATGTIEKLVAGLVPGQVSTLQTVASPTGFEPVF